MIRSTARFGLAKAGVMDNIKFSCRNIAVKHAQVFAFFKHIHKSGLIITKLRLRSG